VGFKAIVAQTSGAADERCRGRTGGGTRRGGPDGPLGGRADRHGPGGGAPPGPAGDGRPRRSPLPRTPAVKAPRTCTPCDVRVDARTVVGASVPAVNSTTRTQWTQACPRPCAPTLHSPAAGASDKSSWGGADWVVALWPTTGRSEEDPDQGHGGAARERLRDHRRLLIGRRLWRRDRTLVGTDRGAAAARASSDAIFQKSPLPGVTLPGPTALNRWTRCSGSDRPSPRTPNRGRVPVPVWRSRGGNAGRGGVASWCGT
jgi:hypothetical protein